MSDHILNMFLIMMIVVFIIDISGFMPDLKRLLFKHGVINGQDDSIKPFDCSLCTTWWCGIVYMLITHSLSLYGLCTLSILSASTSVVAAAWVFVNDFIGKHIDKFYNND